MATGDAADVLSTTALAGLVVAGVSLGAVYAFQYTPLGRLLWPADVAEDTPAQTHSARSNVHKGGGGGSDEGEVKDEVKTVVGSASGTVAQKRRPRKKGKGAGVAEGEGESEIKSVSGSKGEAQVRGGAPPVVPLPRVLPGDFDGVSADVGSSEASPAGMTSKQAPNVKTQKKKKQKTKKQKQRQDNKDGDEDNEAGSETDKEVDVGRSVVRSGDSTDASVSLYPSVSGDALPGSSRAATRGSLGASARLAPLSHSREVRPSLSFDTDSSWTHVNHRHLKTFKSMDGHARGLADAVDTTSSDLASTASDSPVAERMDNVTTNMQGARADLEQRTLAEKLVPRPRKTAVDDMLEQPDFPTLARVMRVQPPADETPVPGFSWEDYGDVVEDSVLVHDADEEDEGEWGVIKSRHRTQHPQTTSTPASTSHAASAPETMTKKQRQNARKRELAKSVKAEAEAVRLEGLAKHKRELERLRIIEQSQQGGGKKPSGGMHATVDDRGKLVWE